MLFFRREFVWFIPRYILSPGMTPAKCDDLMKAQMQMADMRCYLPDKYEFLKDLHLETQGWLVLA